MSSFNHLTFAFIGAGNMSGAILEGMISNGVNAKNIIATNRSHDKQRALKERLGIHTEFDNAQAIAKADVVILGVKPQMMKALLTELTDSGVTFDNKLILTVAAGLNIHAYTDIIGQQRFIRAMPNTPSMLGLGACGLYLDNNFEYASATEKQTDTDIAEFMFTSVGKFVWLEEEAQIDDIAAVSGSGPAYFFLFMETLIKQAKAFGFSQEVADMLVKQTALGAAEMAIKSEHSVEQLRANVTSPGGTTAAAIEVFEQQQLENIVSNALVAAVDKAKVLSKL